MLKPTRSKITAFLVGLVVVASTAFAVNTFYARYNPATGQFGVQGLLTSGGTVPLITSTSCGVVPSPVGGTSFGNIAVGTGGAVVPVAAAVNLGAASTFGVLGGSAVTNTGNTTVVGDIGSAPTNSITGFPPGTFTGTNHGNDSTATAAQVALALAYTDASTRTPATTLPGDIGGMVLTAGYYNASSSLGITGTVTLNGQGNSNAVFIIQTGTTLTTATNAVVLLTNGAQAGNVFWAIGSSATLGTGTVFVGTILAHTSISVTGGGSVNGRLLANIGAVTFAAAETVAFDGSGGAGTGGSNVCGLTITLPTPTIVVSSGLNDGKNAVNSAAVPNRLACAVINASTPSALFIYSSVPTTTSCSFTGTVNPGDILQYRIYGY